ncbi:MAG: hypothetical protein JWN22_2844 [Nocardioides sp.]|jgi:hypothetical protein|nr:hypothetical protein [Nocardioides sp.]
MSVPATPSRPASKSVGAATLGLIATLAIFVAVFVTFLVAPLVALLLAYLAYTVMRSRAGRSAQATGPDDAPTQAHGFGAGTQ